MLITRNSARITNDTVSSATYYPVFVASTSGTAPEVRTSSSKMTYDPSTGTLSATSVNSLSDINAKENIKPLHYTTYDFMQVSPVEYSWKDGSGDSFGFIAQDIEQIYPEAVATSENGTKTLNYGILTAVLFKQVQMLYIEVAQLKTKLDQTSK